ncbi:MAG TPA: YtxH domain-containing protein [Armatimonadetes bacterium]|nr:YtxH domain-containing protein [Armatimonadota bacterium]
MSERKSNEQVLMVLGALSLGAACGLVVGLLCAPQRGSVTWGVLRHQWKSWQQQAKGVTNRLLDHLEEWRQSRPKPPSPVSASPNEGDEVEPVVEAEITS